MTDIASEPLVDTAEIYRRRTKKRIIMMVLGFVVLLVSLIVDVSWGPSSLGFVEAMQAIIKPGSLGVRTDVIVWELRLPIAILAILVGAMLGLAGAEMQTILNNPLADPFTLGISSAAAFGAALAIVLQFNIVPGAGQYLVMANAFAMSILASFMLYAFTKVRGVTAETMVLVGIAMMFTFNALLAMMQYGASENQLGQIVFWMMGSLSRASWDKIAIASVVLLVIVPFFVSRNWSLTALRMGDDKAASLGVNVKRLRIEMLIGISLLAATAVSFVGTVAFVGLVGPHIARMIVGEDQRYFLPLSAFAGGLIMSLTSIVSKSITPGVIYPIGIITSLIGIPFFLSLILAVRRRSWS